MLAPHHARPVRVIEIGKFDQIGQRSVVSCLRARAIVKTVSGSDGLRDSPAYMPG